MIHDDQPLSAAELAFFYEISAPLIAGFDLWPAMQERVALRRGAALVDDAAALARFGPRAHTGLYATLLIQRRVWRSN